MRFLPFALAAAVASTAACDASITTEDGVPTNDPLYAEIKQQCGDDAVVLRVEQSIGDDDEAMCCLTYTAFVPSVHCMTASGGNVTNPSDMSKLVQVSKQAKLKNNT